MAQFITNIEKLNSLLQVIQYLEENNIEIPNTLPYQYMKEFILGQIELNDRRNIYARNLRKRDRALGDEIRQQILAVLKPDIYMTVEDIKKAINREDLNFRGIAARANQLVDKGLAEKDYYRDKNTYPRVMYRKKE